MKARFIKRHNKYNWKRQNNGYLLEYEYKGRRYFIDFDNCNCITNCSYYGIDIKQAHKVFQNEIDDNIEKEQNKTEKEYDYKKSAEYGFKIFWDTMEN